MMIKERLKTLWEEHYLVLLKMGLRFLGSHLRSLGVCELGFFKVNLAFFKFSLFQHVSVSCSVLIILETYG